MTNLSSDHIVGRARYLMPLAGLAIISLLGLRYTSSNIDNNKNIEYETPSYENVLRQLELVTQDANSQPHLRKLPTVCVSGVCLETTNSPTSTPLPEEPFNATKLDDIDDACQMTDILGPTEIPVDTVFENTIIVGYPGADKRTVLRNAEAMTTLSGRDSWDLKYLGMTLQPFIKTNYPHHEGIWGWGSAGDQVVLVVRNIRFTIDSYHDILADIDYAKTWEEATEKIPKLYKGEIYEVLYNAWRDERTMDEIGWYGWLIDYWMEGGILRDYFDHKITTPEHWALLRAPELWTYGELQWDVNNCPESDGPIEISYDEVCDSSVTADCKAKIVISAERFMANETGKIENAKLGRLLSEAAGVSDYLVNETAWDCVWDELIGNNPEGESPGEADGYIDYRHRDDIETRSHRVSTRHLNKMIMQLTRLINKYSSLDTETGINWTISEQAQFLVEILTEHRAEIQDELDNTPVEQNWPHPPKTNWVVFPKCGPEAESGRRVWDYDYSDWVQDGYSGLVMDMFPNTV